MAKPIGLARIAVVLLLAVVLDAQDPSPQLISENPSLRQIVLRQLAIVPGPEKSRYIPELIRLLRGKYADRALPAFAKVGSTAGPALFNLLDDPDRRVRGFAAEALATIRPIAPETVVRLRLMLKDSDPWVRQRVAGSLLSIGIPDQAAQSIVREQWKFENSPPSGPKPTGTVPDWIQLLSSDSSFVVEGAVHSLKNAGEPAIPDLIEALKSQNPKIRAGAVEALRRMHLLRSDIEAACIQALQDSSARVRQPARDVLLYQVTEAAMDALLEDEIAELARKEALERRAETERAQPHSRPEILAPIPADPDNTYPLEVTSQFETKSPDGTVLFTVLHTGKDRGDLLRVWRFRQDSYDLVKEDNTDESHAHLSARGFHFEGKAYLHVMRLSNGTGYLHEDEFYRIESGGLIKLNTPKGRPLVLAPGEGVWKSFFEDFHDDYLGFEFGIWKDGDASCCPTAGWVKGTYTIVGDELKYATWNRSSAPPPQ